MWITTATAVFREDKYEFYFKPLSRLNPAVRLAIGSFWRDLKQCEDFILQALICLNKRIKLVMAGSHPQREISFPFFTTTSKKNTFPVKNKNINSCAYLTRIPVSVCYTVGHFNAFYYFYDLVNQI